MASATPCVALLMALAVLPALGRTRVGLGALLLALAILAGANVSFLYGSAGEIRRGTWTGDYGVPYRDSLEAARFLLERHGSRGRFEVRRSRECVAVGYLASMVGLGYPDGAQTDSDRGIVECLPRQSSSKGPPAVEEWRSASGALRMRLYREKKGLP
jgi:hypothetical protein